MAVFAIAGKAEATREAGCWSLDKEKRKRLKVENDLKRTALKIGLCVFYCSDILRWWEILYASWRKFRIRSSEHAMPSVTSVGSKTISSASGASSTIAK